jgi:hypothetical protein
MESNFDIVAIVALVASAVVPALLFYFGHTRSKKSEQIRISREIWDRIETQYHIIKTWTLLKEPVRQSMESRIGLKRARGTLRNELGYLVRLVEEDEIQEPFIFEYYQEKLFDIHFIAKSIGKWYADIRGYREMQEILELVKKYHELTDKIKEYEAEDSSI